MKNEVTGRVVAVPPAQTGMGQRGPWVRQTVVVEFENGRYDEKIALECSNSKAEDFGKLKEGQKGTFYYDVTSREYNDRWYTTANCFDWKIEGASAPASPAAGDSGPF